MATYHPTIFEEIEFSSNDYREIELTGTLNYGNSGIGRYEFNGYKKNDVQMRIELDNVSWEDHLYTEEENKVIDDYVGKNTDKLEDKFIDKIV